MKYNFLQSCAKSLFGDPDYEHLLLFGSDPFGRCVCVKSPDERFLGLTLVEFLEPFGIVFPDMCTYAFYQTEKGVIRIREYGFYIYVHL